MAGAVLSYGKRCLKAVLDKASGDGEKLKRRKPGTDEPEKDFEFWCKAGIDKEGFKVKYISDYKGFGVFASKVHRKGEFLLEYVGERITKEEAEERENKYPENKTYYFSFNGKQQCIDASATQGHICQYVNDGNKKDVNCVMRLKEVCKYPRLCLYALRDIYPKEELLYDYGDGKHLWWRMKKTNNDYHDDDDEDDDDPFDVGKISDTSSSSENTLSIVSNSCNSNSDMSDLIQPIPLRRLEFNQTKDQSRKNIQNLDNMELSDSLNNDCVEQMEPSSPSNGECVKQMELSDSLNNDCVEQMEPSSPSNGECVKQMELSDSLNNDCVEQMEPSSPSNGECVKQMELSDSINNDCVEQMEPSSLSNGECVKQIISPPAALKGVKQKERPGRFCIFCKKIITGGKLKRHIKTHKNSNEEVAAILKKHVQEQNKWFETKRIEGMYEYNLMHIDSIDEANLMRERKTKSPDNVRMCQKCKRFISNRTFYKHKEKCGVNSDPIKKLSLQTLINHRDSGFVINILNKFRDGEVGSFIRNNKIVQSIGYKHFLARRSESSKANEIRKEIMMEMREITRLFLCFQKLSEVKVSIEDIYRREHLSVLKEAFNALCETETGDQKHGLKVNLNNVFQRSIKNLSGYYAESCQDSKVKELKKFQQAYNYCVPEIVGESRYHTDKKSLRKARLPKNLPEEQEMIKLKNFIQREIDLIVKNFTLGDYTWLRSLVVSRLTLYNARRGEEGSRLLIKEWHDAMAEIWVPPENKESIKDDAENYLVGQFKLAYMAGKGKKYVPVLIPNDLIPSVEILLSNRDKFGILEDNIFVFATKSSVSHCSGWHAVSSVCGAAGVSVNATKNRHRASTVYASLEMTDVDRRIFFDHLGHDELINKENYQCPPGLKEIEVMGKFLNDLDGGSKDCTFSTCSNRTNISSGYMNEEAARNENGPEEVNLSPMRNLDCSNNNHLCKASFRWNTESTSRIKKDFHSWIQVKSGNPLPSKKDLEAYLGKCVIGCSLTQLRTKIMNEQNKRRKIIKRKMEELQSD